MRDGNENPLPERRAAAVKSCLSAGFSSVMKEKVEEIFARLAAHYGPLHWWPADSPFEVAVGAILTQNTAWRNVEYALANLQKAEALTAPALLALPREQLQQLIRPAGFFRQKAERLQLLAACLLQQHAGDLPGWLAGPLPQVRRQLLAMKGIGPETADSILLYAGHRPTFVVDAYTRRIFVRLGLLGGQESYEQIRALFMDHLAADAALFNEYHALIVEHAKSFCRKAPRCAGCPLQELCCAAVLQPRGPAPALGRR
jgi:endonuclease III related protein